MKEHVCQGCFLIMGSAEGFQRNGAWFHDKKCEDRAINRDYLVYLALEEKAARAFVRQEAVN